MERILDSFGLLVVVAFAAFASGVAATINATNSVWKDDCEKIGAHRSGDQVYDCKPRAK